MQDVTTQTHTEGGPMKTRRLAFFVAASMLLAFPIINWLRKGKAERTPIEGVRFDLDEYLTAQGL